MVDVRSRRVVRVESLCRWRHPRLGLTPPDEFIPLVEHSALVGPFTLWVLDDALRQCRAWWGAGFRIGVSVNLSARNLHDPRLVPAVGDRLAHWGIEPAQLTVEITESAILADLNRAVEGIARLREMGVRVSVDDFGSGYSSFTQLVQLRVDEVKIDKSFVLDGSGGGGGAAVVRAITDLGHDLGLEVVVEGVEGRKAWDTLVGFGCDLAQGYFMGRPAPAEEISHWLRHSPWGVGSGEGSSGEGEPARDRGRRSRRGSAG